MDRLADVGSRARMPRFRSVGDGLSDLRFTPVKLGDVVYEVYSLVLDVSGREGLTVWFGHLLSDDCVDGLGPGEDVDTEVAAAFGPFIVLLGQDGAHEPDDSGPVWEDPDHVGAAADLAVETFVGVVGPDLAPDLLGERREREDVGPGLFEVVSHRGKLLGQGVDDAVELGVHPGGVGLVVYRVQQ